MKIFLFLTFIPCLIFAQNSNLIKDPNQPKKLSIGVAGGNYTQIIELNDEHLTNINSYIASVNIDYLISEYTYLKTGFDRVTTVSFSGLSYKAYKIPFAYGINFFSGHKHNSEISLQSEIGSYYRIINDFTNNTSVNYSDNNVFGFQYSFNVRYDVSNKMFALLNLQISRDFDDILESEQNTIRVDGSYALQLGIGIKF